ncbi:hypothetical protein kac65v162_gp197 [Nodularia phage vB_NspS-kac65v162]|jgi:hypothetical protein|uniref:Uncharacterized protein n=3 Tax=Ravarandavirus kac65v151 TaxID=2845689 RepID=A0A482MIL0_9CAUD|nr:hypothetical protein HWC12_gp120 [Nodularia phage vB_NspS-kac65v151]QBQ73227.1 hypothetical protein kac65v151_gp197 [Nodularia phage vB_NspS-kac65v151]QBQ73435.1 hypothetical protein kac65v161_gp197 [Nodularia phage vB_NspS-kac65v161]QBQ73641.1 hypothetical protein kac65v162_gp197 [Nodularia phage vB_NspS-kac65v162]
MTTKLNQLQQQYAAIGTANKALEELRYSYGGLENTRQGIFSILNQLVAAPVAPPKPLRPQSLPRRPQQVPAQPKRKAT